MNDDTPFFSVLVPVLNEAKHIRVCLTTLLSQIPPHRGELILIDRGSSDGTLAIAHAMAEHHAHLRIIHNPGRIQSIGCNLGASMSDSRSSVLIRADAHASYPHNFVDLCLLSLQTKDVKSVVVPMRTLGDTPIQRAIAGAQNSVLGNGGSRHRRSGVSGYVEHGHHAAFMRNFFMSLGGYDETFSHNEDAELDIRAQVAGGRIWLCADATIGYFPRSSFSALARQYRRHGAGRARTVIKHRRSLKLRQLLPICALASCLIAPAGIFNAMFALPITADIILCLLWSVALAIRHRDVALLASGLAASIMHVSWAFGFLETVITSPEHTRNTGCLRKSSVLRS